MDVKSFILLLTVCVILFLQLFKYLVALDQLLLTAKISNQTDQSSLNVSRLLKKLQGKKNCLRVQTVLKNKACQFHFCLNVAMYVCTFQEITEITENCRFSV